MKKKLVKVYARVYAKKIWQHWGVLVNEGSCLICYGCMEEKGGKCKPHDGTYHGTQVCQHSEVCVKHILFPVYRSPVGAKEVIERFCVNKEYCNLGLYLMMEHKHELKTRKCITCNSNLCNSAPYFGISSVTVILLSATYYVL